mmetsp:Transcript_70806/g.211127  ORF Transcript_70806/g.211127 Transcript_70806/m.211127 type:complete len:211 (-) Transcript_70806:131-763(-)
MFKRCSLSSALLDEGKCELLHFHSNLAVDVRRPPHLRDAVLLAELHQLHLHDERVPRHDGLSELDAVNARKEELALAVRDRRLQADNAAELCHGLDHEDAGHDRPVREVARELGLVGGDVLHAHGPLARLVLQDLVDQQERIPMRQDLGDSDVVHHERHGLSQPRETLGPLPFGLLCLIAGAPPHTPGPRGRGAHRRGAEACCQAEPSRN